MKLVLKDGSPTSSISIFLDRILKNWGYDLNLYCDVFEHIGLVNYYQRWVKKRGSAHVDLSYRVYPNSVPIKLSTSDLGVCSLSLENFCILLDFTKERLDCYATHI